MSGIIPNQTGAGDASAANQTNGAQKTQLVDAGGEVATVTGGKLDVNASVDTTGLATSTIQTDGTQKSQIVDAGGEVVTVTGGKLDVNASVDTTGLATSAKQDTGNTSLASIDGKITAVNTGAVVVSSSALPTGASTGTKQDTGNTSLASIDGKITAVNTGAVVVSSSALPSGASTGAKQDTGNASVASIDTKTPALGQALAAASVPVVLTAAQITTLTPQTNSLTDTQLRATPVPISGTITATPTGTQNVDVTANTIGLSTAAKQDAQTALLTTIDGDTSNLDVALSTRTKPSDQQHTIVDSGTLTAVTAITNPLPAGTNAIGKLSANSGVDIGDVDVTSVSGNVTVVQPTGTNLHSVIDSGTITTVSTVTSVTAIANALPAGNNNIGDVDIASIAAGNNNIGDVDVASIAAGTNIIGKVGIDQTTPGTTNGVQVNAALPAGSNIIGNVRIDQTTPGTTNAVQANAGTNLNTSLLALEAGGNLAAIAASASVLDDWDETDRAKVNIIAGQVGVAASDGNVDALTQRIVVAANVLSTNNSSTTPLTSGGVFTGTSEDIMSYNVVRVTVYSDVTSGIDGFSMQQSTDNTNWIVTDTYTIPAAIGKTFSVPTQARYFRIVYTNGSVAQSTFILQTIYKRIASKSSSQRPNDNYTNETDLEQEQSFLMNYNNSTGTWYRTRGDATNGLLVNPNGFNVDYSRKLQEQQVLYAYSALMEELGATERYNSSRDFIEIR